MDLDLELEHLNTGDTVDVSRWDFKERLDTISTLQADVSDPYKFHHGDLVKFSFPVSAQSAFLRTFYGIIGDRSLKTNSIVAYDYGALMGHFPAVFNVNDYVGFEVVSAILDLIEREDDNSYIDTSLAHGTSPEKFIIKEDNIRNNSDAWTAALRFLPLAFDASNDWYLLPYHIYFIGDKIVIDKRQDIEDSSTYPSVFSLDNSDLWGAVLRESDEDVANMVKCDGLDGNTITVEDVSSTTPYSSYDFPQKYKTISYASSQLDELQEQAVNYILLNRILRGEYEINPVDLNGVALNTVIDITSDSFGVDGRFVVTGIRWDSNMRLSVTISGQQLAISDVL